MQCPKLDSERAIVAHKERRANQFGSDFGLPRLVGTERGDMRAGWKHSRQNELRRRPGGNQEISASPTAAATDVATITGSPELCANDSARDVKEVEHRHAAEWTERGKRSELMRALDSRSDHCDHISLRSREDVSRERAGKPRANRGEMRRVDHGEQIAGLDVMETQHATDRGRFGRDLCVHLDGVGRYPRRRAGKEDRGRSLTSTRWILHTMAKLIDQPISSGLNTRDRIVEAARRLFFRQGYTATGLSQILKAANVRSGSFYHFFPSKGHLLRAVLNTYLGLLEPDILRPAFERAVDPVDRLFAVLDGYRRLLQATDFELGCPIGNFALELSTSHPAARPLIAENFEAWSNAITTLIESFADHLPRDVRPAALTRHVQATMEGAIMLARAYRSFEPFDDAMHQLRDYFERLLRDGASQDRPETR